ncbi:hypothetical protein BC834DRAFT_879483 [Gloeopeniophorella convolvens]|nr:hypothetical protein BC834DRAFT_879483 [Gloeopeniophorella convolvens]
MTVFSILGLSIALVYTIACNSSLCLAFRIPYTLSRYRYRLQGDRQTLLETLLRHIELRNQMQPPRDLDTTHGKQARQLSSTCTPHRERVHPRSS